MSAALEVREVTAGHRGAPVLRAVSFTLAFGQVTGLVGPNGAGKSTLFDVVSGALGSERGSILLSGRDVTRLPVHRRAALGLGRTFQRLEPFTSLSVGDNLLVAAEAAARRRTGPGGTAPHDVVHGLLKRFGLVDFAGQPVARVPAGAARLVEIARALAAGARVLLLDEPSSGMDARQVEDFAGTVRALRDDGLSIMLVEHDEQLVAAVCDRVFGLSRAGGWRPAPSRSG